MAAETPSEQAGHAALEKKVHTRRSHNKVRSGCLTCKLRRKKCDEVKPFCLRCTSTGRKCDGYPSIPSSSITAREYNHKSTNAAPSPTTTRATLAGGKDVVKAFSNIAWTMRRTPDQNLFVSEVDMLCFDYFKTVTGPQLGNYHDSSMYNQFAVRAALLHPVVMKAAAAVGAANRRYDLGISKEAFEYCAISENLYKESNQCLAAFRSNSYQHQYAPEIIAVVELLYGVFEVFQGNHGKASQHVSDSLVTLWDKPFSILHSESRYMHTQARPGLFPSHFKRLAAYATHVLSRGPRILTDFQTEPLPPVPPIFSSLEEGLDLVFTQIQYVLHTPASIWVDEKLKTKLQMDHVRSTLEWSAALAETTDTMPNRTPQQARACLYLRRCRNALYVLLYLVFYIRNNNNPNRHSLQESLNSNLPRTNSSSEEIFDISQYLRSEEDQEHEDSHETEAVDFEKSCADGGLVIEDDLLWEMVNNREDLTTNLSRVQLFIDELLDPTSKFDHHPYTMSINMDTGIGPPRTSEPGPDASSKTRHLVRSLLDPCSREKLHKPTPEKHTTFNASNSSLSLVSTNKANSSVDKLPGKVYPIAEQLCSIEEHAIFAAAEKSLIIPRGLTPTWLDVSCFLEERKMLLRYCCRDDRMAPGTGSGMIWTQEWVKF